MTSAADPTTGRPLLWGGAALALAGLAGVLMSAPDVLPWAIPVLALLIVAVILLPAAPTWETWGFGVVILLSTSALGSDGSGTDLLEISFGIALLGYVAAWYAKTLLGGRRFIRSWTDVAALAFFLLGGLGGLAVAVLVGTDPSYLRSDLTCVLALALYFPVRELCVRAERGPEMVAIAILFLGLMATVSSALLVYNALTGATELYEVVDVRVSMGEIQVIAGLLIGLLWTTVARHVALRSVLVVVVAGLLGGLILAKSRGPWITAVLGLLVAGAISPPAARRRLMPYAVGGVAAMLLAGIVVLGNRLVLIGIGLVNRLASISGALTQDVSLLNRYAETSDALDAIAASPIFGHGWGATLERFDLIAQGSYRVGFLHNGYVWLMHKVGVVGLLCFLAVFAGALLAGLFAARSAGGTDRHRALAAAATGVLVAYAILALPSNPFAVLDQMLVVTLVLGLASGLWERTRLGRPSRL